MLYRECGKNKKGTARNSIKLGGPMLHQGVCVCIRGVGGGGEKSVM